MSNIHAKPKKSPVKLAASVLTVAVASVALAACSIGRVSEVKEQFCNFESNFSYSTDDNPYLGFGQPVLLDSDVTAMIGYEPSEVIMDEQGMLHRYVIEKLTLDDSPAETLVFELRYDLSDGKSRLQSIHLPPQLAIAKNFEAYNDPETVAAAAAEICSSEVKFSFRPAEEDIDPRLLENLPDRSQMIAMIGAPSWESEEENAMIYEYRVQGSSDYDAPVRMAIWFDEANVKPLRMETRYRFIHSKADLEDGKVQISYGI
jgi:hypothetical protein